jgi:hypothetical protein
VVVGYLLKVVAYHVPLNDGVNLIRYSLNPEKKLVKNYVVVGYLLKVVALVAGVIFLFHPTFFIQLIRSGLFQISQLVPANPCLP